MGETVINKASKSCIRMTLFVKIRRTKNVKVKKNTVNILIISKMDSTQNQDLGG